MSKGFLIGAGGGGSDLYAAIGVLVDDNAPVTCENLNTGVSLEPAAPANGRHIFAIPQPGSWRVTSGAFTNTVEVEEQGQCEIVRLNRFYLINGTAFGVTWTRKASYGANVANVYAPNSFEATSQGGKLSITASTGFRRGCVASDKIDLTGFNKLHFDLLDVDMVGDGTDVYCWITSDVDTKNFQPSVVKTWYLDDTASHGSYRDKEIDISDISGEYHIAFDIRTRAATSSYYINNVFLD